MVIRRYISMAILRKAQQEGIKDGNQQPGQACEKRILVKQLVG